MKGAILPAKRPTLVTIIIIASVALYLAGVMSGLYANKVLEERTKEDIESLQAGTAEQLRQFKKYIDFLEENLNSMQLEQGFLETLPPEERCNFSSSSVNYLLERLQYYRDQLPYRIEAYERNNALSKEYLSLKEEYDALSLRTWVLARYLSQQCDPPMVTGLYLYSGECERCVEQGEALDRFTAALKEEGYAVMLFTVDYETENPPLPLIKRFYRLNATPAIIIGERVFQGRVYGADELLEAIR